MADREGQKVDCLGAGLRLPQFRGSLSSSIRDLGRVYGLAGRGSAMVAVGLGGDWATRGSAQVTDSDSQQSTRPIYLSVFIYLYCGDESMPLRLSRTSSTIL